MTVLPAERLPAWSLFAGTLAAAGLPIYIHAPRFYVDQHGVGLASLGVLLFGLRLLDVVQDPALGWLSERLRARRQAAVGVAAGVLALAMVGLFAMTPPVAPLLWFGLTLAALFSAFSFLTICFYAEGVAKAARLGPSGHVRLAAWRETGALAGISLAALAPTVLAAVSGGPFALFAAGFAGLCLLAAAAMRGEWGGAPSGSAPGFSAVLRDPVARRLLVLALVNAAPVAVTSTLFLFFVESRLAAPGWEGPLLVLFFLSAALSAPAWSAAAAAWGTRAALLAGMSLAIASFGFAATLGAGDVAAFAVICVASGAALGADMTLLPAAFAARMARVAPSAAAGFGLWSFVSKFTLAFAAVTLLPLLEASGLVSGGASPPGALAALTLLYAVLPCALKLAAVALLAATPLPEG